LSVTAAAPASRMSNGAEHGTKLLLERSRGERAQSLARQGLGLARQVASRASDCFRPAPERQQRVDAQYCGPLRERGGGVVERVAIEGGEGALGSVQCRERQLRGG